MTTQEQKKYRLEEIAFFQEGPGLRNWQWTPDGMKVINGTNILLSGQVDTSNTDKFISLQEFDSRYKHFEINDGDLVLTSSGTLGKVGRIRSENLPLMMNTSVIRFRSKNPKILLDDFLHCYLRSPEFQAKIRSFAVGGAQQNFGPSHLKQISLPLPTLREQAAIAETVTAYDDLIENNRRRIKLLEDAARLLYREWFVHLHFRGHEHVKVVDGVPEGWARKPLRDVATLNYGKALKEELRQPGSVPVYGSSGIVGRHTAELSAGPGIIVGRKGNVGSVYWSPVGYFAIDTVYFITADQSSFYLYYALQHAQFISTDVAVPGLNREFAHSRPILVPSDRVLDEFIEVVTSTHKQIDTLSLFNEKLRQARDLLLPRLMSGELAV